MDYHIPDSEYIKDIRNKMRSIQDTNDFSPLDNQEKVDILGRIVRQVFHVEDTTWGTTKDGFLVRFRGRLVIDSEEAYDQLARALEPHGITPLFRIIDNKQTIFLKEGIIKPRPSKVWVNLLLFALTVLSMLYAGTIYTLGGLYDGPASPDLQTLIPYIKDALGGGIAFTISILAILLSHEFGHFFTARYHKTEVSLPYFIPFPSLFGTMGAVILTKEVPKNKKVLLDIGIAGPLAGLIVTIPIVIYGLATSEIHQLPLTLPDGMGFEGNSLLYLGLKYLVHGMWLPQPADFGGMSPWLYWLRYFFSGQPLPVGGVDVTMNSVALAGWAGLLVTGLNLIPIGQLDGGHLIYGIFGRRTERIVPIIIIALAIMGFFWSGWWLWAVLLLFFNRKHGEPLDEITPLDQKRKIIAIVGLIIFLVVFIPVPMTSPIGR
jgi:membrane-associated protease RseP (regulator of RpoE activity)